MKENERSEIKIGKHVAFRLIGDEVVIVDSRSSEMLTLNSTASVIWMHVTRGMPRDEIADVLAAEFDVTHGEALEDIAAFIENMISRGLILKPDPLPEAL